ncbi:MAG: LPS export ABC transporter permease LptG [Desulfobacterota bacterium]|nr:LPS export ABC transporter permease LptG [Thermodesulfobacteriota bacterium]
MLIITRYFAREFFRTFLLCIACFAALYILVDLFERLDDMLRNNVSFSLIIIYYLSSLPMIFYQVAPFAVLLCSFITVGIFNRHNEIMALKAHGISLFRVLHVFILVSGAIFLFSFWLQEYVLPYTNTRAKEIKNINIKGKQPSKLFKKYHFWYRTQDGIYSIDFFDPEKNMLQKISILYLDKDFSIIKRLDAESATWAVDAWMLRNVTEREFYPDGSTRAYHTAQKKVSLQKTPEDFRSSRKEAEEMSFSEIRAFTKKMRAEGYPTTAYEVEMHAKVSYAFIAIIMCLLAIPFALRIGRSGEMAIGIAVSVALGFLYWLFYAFCLSLGKSGALPPFLAAWTANIAFGFVGVYMFLHVRQ